MKTKHLVIDTAAFVKYVPIWEYGEEFYSIPEVIGEIRDKIARQRYDSLPVTVKMREPQPWAIKFINQFSKKTGDYASLSLADVKILALSYELEIEARGSSDHLRLEPQKPVIEGPGSKPKLEDQLPDIEGFHLPTEKSAQGLMTNSSDQLPLSPESLTEDESNVSSNNSSFSTSELYINEDPKSANNQHQDQYSSSSSFTLPSSSNNTFTKDSTSNCQLETNIYWCHMLGLEDFLGEHSYVGGYCPTSDDTDLYEALTKEYPQFRPSLKDKYSNIFAAALNLPPSTMTLRPLHSTFPRIRRWSYHISSFSEEEKREFPSSGRNIAEVLHDFGEREQNREASSPIPNFMGRNTALLDPSLQVGMCALSVMEQSSEINVENNVEDEKEISVVHPNKEEDVAVEANGTHKEVVDEEESEESSVYEETDIQYDENIEELDVNYEDEENDEEEDSEDDDDEGWITPSNIKRHKLKSNNNKPMNEEEKEKDVLVACMTSDFAIQNILKHIGLSVMGVDGKLIWQIRTFILRCYACFKTTSDMTRLFCPKCGNKTLKRVSVTVNPDGTQKIWINFKKPINTKGMIFTLPQPRGGQHARNPILVADQREVKQFSNKMYKKSVNPLHEDYDPDNAPFAIHDVYSRAAQLGYIDGKCHNHYYWERKNPNAPMKKSKKNK